MIATILAAWVMTAPGGIFESYSSEMECDKATQKYNSQFHRPRQKMKHKATCKEVSKQELKEMQEMQSSQTSHDL